MRLHLRDWTATVLVGAVVVPYVGYLLRGTMPFVQDPRGMAAIGLVLGVPAAVLMRRGATTRRRATVDLALSVVSLALGVATFAFAETIVAEALLALFMVSIVLVWAARVLDHAGLLPTPRGPTPAVPG